jgi:hypothetical protein
MTLDDSVDHGLGITRDKAPARLTASDLSTNITLHYGVYFQSTGSSLALVCHDPGKDSDASPPVGSAHM